MVSFKKVRGPLADAAIIAALSVACVLVGLRALEDWHGPALSISNDMYIPAVMFASGRGFINVPAAEVPGLKEFLAFDRQEFSLPPDAPLPAPVSLDAYQEYHPYLVFAAGVVWRLLGVSWGAMKVLILLLFAVSAALVYALFRLVTGRVVGAAGAALFLFAPLMPWVLFSVRDFSKVPFFLGVFLACGLLLRRPAGTRRLLWCAVFAGVCTGVGLGFRRDLMVCLPPVTVVLMACRTRGAGILPRLAAVAVLLAVFLLASWPVLGAFHRHGTLGSHDVLMGMSTSSDDFAKLERASYERMPAHHDFYVFMATVGHTRRTHPDLPWEQLKTQYIMDLAKAFPGDMVARAHAAMLEAFRGVMSYPAMKRCLNLYPLAALGAVMLIAARDVRTAALFVFLLLYFCGITTLQFHYRHVIHLSFLPYWFAGLLLSAAWRRLGGGRRGQTASPPGAGRRAAGRALIFVAVLFFLLWAPLVTGRFLQRGTLAEMAAAYRGLEWVPARMSESQRDGLTVLAPADEGPCVSAGGYGAETGVRLGFLMLEFDGPLPDPCIAVTYEDSRGEPACRHFVAPFAGGPAGVIRQFVPVYAVTSYGSDVHFSGLEIPTESLPHLLGVYRAVDPVIPGTLVTLSLPVEGPPSKCWQTLRFPGGGGPGPPCTRIP